MQLSVDRSRPAGIHGVPSGGNPRRAEDRSAVIESLDEPANQEADEKQRQQRDGNRGAAVTPHAVWHSGLGFVLLGAGSIHQISMPENPSRTYTNGPAKGCGRVQVTRR